MRLIPKDLPGIIAVTVTQLSEPMNPQPKPTTKWCGETHKLIGVKADYDIKWLKSPTGEHWAVYGDGGHASLLKPQYKVGQVLWLAETWATNWPDEDNTRPSDLPEDTHLIYKASADEGMIALCRWRPSTQMPQWAARTFVKVTSVKAEQVEGVWNFTHGIELCERPSSD